MISSDDVKLFKSQVIADTPDGGGRMTGVEVVDGELNNLFDDTSRLDRVYGRVSLRKCFGAVTTLNRDKYLGAHAIVTDPPDDGRVVVTILERNDHSDRRAEVQDYVEAYVLAGATTQMTLYDTQPEGSRTLLAYQNNGVQAPEVGDVLALSIELTGHVNNGYEQYVRVTGVAISSITGGNAPNTFTKALLTISIGSALEIDFPGGELVESPSTINRPTRLRQTNINDGVKYYGVTPIAQTIAIGNSTLYADGILQPVVPAAYAETPVLDQQVGTDQDSVIAAGPSFTQTITASSASDGTLTLSLARAAQPGSVLVTLDASNAANDVSFADAGAGLLTRTSGGTSTVNSTGAADYSAGTLSFAALPASISYTATVTYVPAVNYTDVQHTSGTAITLANRGFNYAKTLIPKPAPGAVRVTYRTLGRWYTLNDNGSGQLVGATGTGSGTVNYTTGTVNVTVGYQPDVGSHVLFGWGTAAHYTQQNAVAEVELGAIQITADHPLMVPGTLHASYTIGATTYTFDDNGAGEFTGGSPGTGTVNYNTGVIRLLPNVLPASGATVTLVYDSVDNSAYTNYVPSPQPTPDGAGDVSITLPSTVVRAGTLKLNLTVTKPGYPNKNISYGDDANGNLIQRSAGTGAGQTWGTVNYATGAVTVRGNRLLPLFEYFLNSGTWLDTSYTYTFSSIQAFYHVVSAVTARTDGHEVTALTVDLIAATIDRLIPGSLLFTLNGRNYVDAAGVLYYVQANGALLAAGTIDLQSGLASITDWASGTRVATLRALLTRYGRWPLSSVLWRTPGSPLRPGSFQVTDGVHTAVADDNGVLTGGSTFITGSINQDTGVYSVAFAPSIAPEIGRYNVVVIAYLPLDADILGLNTVRLPLSGTAPIIAIGDTLVVHHTASTTLPNPVVAGQTYDLGRPLLAYAVLYDADGDKVLTDRYTTDLDAGEITFENPLDLNGYTQPLYVEHRIEDMTLCLDAQLSGELQVNGASITHAYPLGSFISSAKLIGDLQSRAGAPFDQQAWTGVWSDVLIGSQANAEYNSVAYPILVTNAGAIEERWRIEFTAAQSFRLFGEIVGQVADGSTLADFAPVNPTSGQPYFTLDKDGWGTGWTAGNQLRFNSFAAAAPLWLLRCTLQGPAEEPNDSVRIQFRGDN